MKIILLMTTIAAFLFLIFFVSPGIALEDSELEITPGKGEQAVRPMRFSKPKIRYKDSDVFYRLEYSDDTVANDFCEGNGFRFAKDYDMDPNIGDVNPTLEIGGSNICSKPHCDGFEFIECSE